MKPGRFATVSLLVLSATILGSTSLAAAPDTLTFSTGSLFLRSDNTLEPDSGGPPQGCLGLTATDPVSVQGRFGPVLFDGRFHLENETIVLSLAFNADRQAGTGFRIDAELQADNQSFSATKSYGTGTSIDSPATLSFPAQPAVNNTGALNLQVTLTKTGGAPVLQPGHNIAIQCNHPNTRLGPFDYARGAVGESDLDGDGIPDSRDLEVTGPGVGGEEPEEEHLRPLTNQERLGVTGIAILAGIVTLIAGLMVLAGKSISEKRAHLLLGGTAGLLLAVALVDLVPEALHEAENAGWTIALGLLALVSIRWITGERSHAHGHSPHPEGDEHEHGEHTPETHPAHQAELRMGRLAVIAFVALLFHRIVDGLALPGAFAAGGAVGITAGAAILVHQFPDGLAAASIFVGSGWKRAKSLKSVGILSFATPVGAIIGLGFATIAGFLPHMLALAAATFIFIALSELLPELRKPEYRWTVATGFLIGYALTFAIGYVADLAGVHV